MICTHLSMMSLACLLLTAVHVKAQPVARPVKPPDSIRKLNVSRTRILRDLPVMGDHCDPDPKSLPVRPPCPNNDPGLIPAIIGRPVINPPDTARTIRMSDMFAKLGVKSSDDIVLEYVRPAGSSRLVNIVVRIYNAKAELIGSNSCDCQKELMDVGEGEAIQFTLKGASQVLTTTRASVTGLSGEHSIAISVGFERGKGPLQQRGVVVARSSRPI